MHDATLWASLAVLGVGVLYVQSRLHDRVTRMDRKLNALLRHFDIESAQALPMSDRVKALASDPARKIEAIRAYRQETGADLAEAKVAVETVLEGR